MRPKTSAVPLGYLFHTQYPGSHPDLYPWTCKGTQFWPTLSSLFFNTATYSPAIKQGRNHGVEFVYDAGKEPTEAGGNQS